MPSPSGWSSTLPVPGPGDPDLDPLVYGTRWADPRVTYSFPQAGSSWSTDADSGYGPSSGDAEPWVGFEALNSDEQAATRKALAAWAAVADVRFEEVADTAASVGDLRFAYSASSVLDDAQAAAWLPSEGAVAGDVWVNARGTSYTAPWIPGSYPYLTMIHEIGHALGLKHPFEALVADGPVLRPELDSRSFTVMSYSADPGDTRTRFSYEPTTPMVLDILAMQHLYGANTDWQSGHTAHAFRGDATYHQTLWDGGGVDTLSYTSALGGTIDLREGHGSALGQPVWVLGADGRQVDTVFNVYIAYGAVIENATGGTGNDHITGNAAANVINGGPGADTLVGGDGSDTYHVDHMGDVVTESNRSAGVGGTDLVMSTLSAFTLGANVENGRIATSRTADMTGNALANKIIAGSGNNVIDGRGGTDTVDYALAASAVTVDLGTRVAQATGGSGTDTLISVENIGGSRFDDRLSGDAGANVISGGLGADTMAGGDGPDTYYVDHAGDTVIELDAGGSDLVASYLAAYTLPANVESGRLLSGGAAKLTGNALDNVLAAGAGSNVIDGGAGRDTADYSLAAKAVAVDLRIAVAQATGGSGADTLVAIENLTGSKYNDRLTGNDGPNVIIGGAGRDTLTGGLGADRFVIHSLVGSDLITDFVRGTDRLAIAQSAVKVGDGDHRVEGSVTLPTFGSGFAPSAELVAFGQDIAGPLTATSAAAHIGSASSAWTTGARALFTLDNGAASAVFLFVSGGNDALVSSSELTLLATLQGSSSLTAGDFVFLT
jgi:Ca2+-binding RTX toxin-like protein